MSHSFAFSRRWGAEPLADGRARFRLWAPAQQTVSVVAHSSDTKRAMQAQGDGWFEVTSDIVPLDTGYWFELADGTRVPDPAARAQMGDVHGPSRLVDPRAYGWRAPEWTGRPWHEAVVYELHTGTFTGDGTFAGVESRLDYLADLGVTAIELMPVAQFSGARGWGYDGVLLYAPHPAYDGPEGLKRLVDAVHARGLMVLLDVVYNHFGPDGNYLHLYAPDFFNPKRQTPWGAAIDYTQPAVRQFVVDNALYWLEEYRFDGLRLDAIDQIHDPSAPTIIEELAAEVRARITDRHIHLTTEDSRNVVDLFAREEGRPKLCTAEWNDDWHHVAHVLATGESEGYYMDYPPDTAAQMARALATGYVYQGERSTFLHDTPRGEPSAHLPPVAFIDFLQNHDQIGNRAFGERLSTLAAPAAIEALTAILLLSPQIPLIYMGEEWGETRPFLFFTDLHGELGDAVREGRRGEFKQWKSFQDAYARTEIPDPNAVETFDRSKLDWAKRDAPEHRARLDYVRGLLALRKQEIAPRLDGVGGHCATRQEVDGRCLHVAWRLGDGSELSLAANLADASALFSAAASGRLLFDRPSGAADALREGHLLPWSAIIHLAPPEGAP
ncbi:MAG: malto-oligosyltrehalose trehalohydrolase [Dichotomicrobium sp.]